MQTDIEDSKISVESLYNCKATFIEDIVVMEKFQDKNVWSGIVHIFKIEGNPKSDSCYAWSSPIGGSTKRRYYAVLKIPPIDSPEKAVRASIVQEQRGRQ